MIRSQRTLFAFSASCICVDCTRSTDLSLSPWISRNGGAVLSMCITGEASASAASVPFCSISGPSSAFKPADGSRPRKSLGPKSVTTACTRALARSTGSFAPLIPGAPRTPTRLLKYPPADPPTRAMRLGSAFHLLALYRM